SAGVPMTPEEFDAITECDENYHYELIHGVLIVSPIAGEVERSPNELLGYRLNQYRFEHPRGSALVETLFEQRIPTGDNRRRADRAIWTVVAGRPQDPRADLPAIVVEFLSAGKAAWRRDYIEKRDEYLAAGIMEYWIFDRFARTMTIYSTKDKQLVEQIVRESDLYQTEILPGFDLALGELLAAADRWSA
ncbi:MAG TPA: Uma2 family endonuclease, partial [Planctomycetaceae bacterium]|nr:Uma2 family endonuclease [Planctomycetaceae bacterium]